MSKRYNGGVVSSDGPQVAMGPALFEFTSFTFLPIVSPGSSTGPTLSQMQSAYAGQPWLSYFSMGSYQGYQRWAVPQTRSYTIEAGGAMGGDGLVYYGSNIGTYAYGAKIQGNFELISGHVIEIVVGVKGGSSGGAHGNENGGGGGTFVRNVTTNTLLLVAGGAGGMPSPSYGTSCTRTVADGHGQSGNSVAVFTCNSTVSAPTIGYGGNSAGSYQGGAGGGYLGAGQNGGTHCATAFGGSGFNTGLVGGSGNTCYDTRNNGGFGGGGGGQLGSPGAGGGYTGGNSAGGWSSYSTYGGGGGSYNIGTSAVNTAGGNTGSLGGSVGAGYCKITKI